jgi:hypothetical protein
VVELNSQAYSSHVLRLAAIEIAELASCDIEAVGDSVRFILQTKFDQTDVDQVADRFRKALDRINIETFLLSSAPSPF